MPHVPSRSRFGLRVGMMLLGLGLAYGAELLAFHVRDPELVGFGLIALPSGAALWFAAVLATLIVRRGDA